MFDLLFLLVVGLSTAFAVLRGGLQEVSTILALAIAAGLAWLIAPPLLSATGMEDSFFGTIIIAAVLIGIIFVIAHIGCHLGLKRIPMSKQHSRINRIGGGIFGFARGLVLIGLGYLGYTYYLDEARQPDSVKNAITQPIAAGMAGLFDGLAPSTTALEGDNATPNSNDENATRDGYERADRASLDEIVTTVTTSGDDPAPLPKDGPDQDNIADILQGDDQ